VSSALRGSAPREGLECLLVKMGRTRPLEDPCRGPQGGKSGDPRSQNADRMTKEILPQLTTSHEHSINHLPPMWVPLLRFNEHLTDIVNGPLNRIFLA